MSENFYIKVGKRYKPMGVLLHDYLSEGVWVVSKHQYSRETTSAKYMNELFDVEKLENLKKLSIGEIGSLHKITEEILQELPISEIGNSFSYNDLVHKIVGMTYDKILEESKRK